MNELNTPVAGIPHTYLVSPETQNRLNDKVVGIFAACHHPISREVVDRDINHWRLYLSTNLGDPARNIDGSSVVIDMVKRQPPDTTAVLCVRARDYPTSINVAHTVGCGTHPSHPTTVLQIIKLLHDKGLLRYKYSANGEGCRFWVQTVIRALEEAGVVAAGAAGRVDAAVPFLWRRPGSQPAGTPSPSPIERGSFY